MARRTYEAHALLALMLVGHGRSAARFRDGELVLLDDQDRWLWDQHQIDEGRRRLERPFALRGNGAYTIQTAIADLHLQEPRDWLALLYERLERITGSAVVTMNRAVAVAELEGPKAALVLLDCLELGDYRYYHSTRRDLLRRLDRVDEARAAYARALELTQPGPEQRFLKRRLADLVERAEHLRAGGTPRRPGAGARGGWLSGKRPVCRASGRVLPGSPGRA